MDDFNSIKKVLDNIDISNNNDCIEFNTLWVKFKIAKNAKKEEIFEIIKEKTKFNYYVFDFYNNNILLDLNNINLSELKGTIFFRFKNITI